MEKLIKTTSSCCCCTAMILLNNHLAADGLMAVLIFIYLFFPPLSHRYIEIRTFELFCFSVGAAHVGLFFYIPGVFLGTSPPPSLQRFLTRSKWSITPHTSTHTRSCLFFISLFFSNKTIVCSRAIVRGHPITLSLLYFLYYFHFLFNVFLCIPSR